MSNNAVSKKDDFLPPSKQELNTDFNYSRQNLYQLIETGMAGIEDYVPIAQQSQNPRAFEVLFNAIKVVAELNEKLADHSVKKEETTHEEKKTEHGETVNQNLYVGSASELLKLAKGMKEDKDDG
jgi:hypothetical protein